MRSFGSLALLFVASVAGAAERPVTFERDIQPILTRSGCNAGACHGKARGQNGFALSLLGFDPAFDHNAIVKEGRGRRLFPSDIDNSLFLLKASGSVPHGGGKKLPVGSPGYDLLKRWIATGTLRTPADAPTLSRITVVPTDIVAAFHDWNPSTAARRQLGRRRQNFEVDDRKVILSLVSRRRPARVRTQIHRSS